MDVDRTMKKKFLTVYDYDTGAIWTYIYANSKQEILKKYPRLEVLSHEPEWFTDENKNTTKTCDIDDDPDSFLVSMTRNE